jgi:hypothetical protein
MFRALAAECRGSLSNPNLQFPRPDVTNSNHSPSSGHSLTEAFASVLVLAMCQRYV